MPGCRAHIAPLRFEDRLLHRVQRVVDADALDGPDLEPSASTAMDQARAGKFAIGITGHDPHSPCSQAFFDPGESETIPGVVSRLFDSRWFHWVDLAGDGESGS